MIYNHTRIKEILTTTGELSYFALLTLEWNATRYLTSLARDVEWNGNSYLSDTTMMQFESPNSTSVVDREAYTLSLNGMDETLTNEIKAGVIHKPVEMRLAFSIDGVPQLGLDDTLLVYRGAVAEPKFVTDDGKLIWDIECTAPLSNLDARSTIFTTKNAMQNLFPTDTCFNQIQKNNEKSSVAWGKT
ncbi:hypothetical protein [Neptunicoccus sediminis]|uniref:hypothetical protein n=1 Tax=Neptunicoccus sediminis TaxID=1892596 RepID=UPI0012FF83C7|nr:hypothetical protein [Neptunicoccus sediminis]